MQPSSGPNWHHGRPGAPKGTKEWADNLRLSLVNQTDHLGEGEADFLLRVDALKREEGWKLLTKPDGSTFGSFDEFCAFRKPYGLGTPWEKLRPFVDAGLAKQGKLSASPSATRLHLSSIRLDGGTQSRAGIDDGVVADYAEHLDALPPVVVFYDGTTYWLADGFHRVNAHAKAGREDIAADVRQGSLRDAILFSCGANAEHGLPRKPVDKENAIKRMLRDAEWSAKGDRFIASTCRVSDKTVAKYRRELVATCGIPHLESRKGQDGKTYPATKPRAEKPAPVALPAEVSQLEGVHPRATEKHSPERAPSSLEPASLAAWADTTDEHLLEDLADMGHGQTLPAPAHRHERQPDLFEPRPAAAPAALERALAAIDALTDAEFRELEEHLSARRAARFGDDP